MKKTLTNKRCFICSIVPNNLVKILRASQASNNFCNSLINNIEFNKILSIWPPTYKIDENINLNENIYYIINKGKNPISNIFYYFICNLQIAYKARLFEKIWYYNLCKTNLLSYIILKFFLYKKIYIILADHTPGKKFSLQYFIEWMIKNSTGIINLSARSMIKNKHQKTIAGIMPICKISNLITSTIKYKFLFSGTLSKVTGFEMALAVFKDLPNLELYITGLGTIPKEYEQYSNIHFLGMLDYNEYINILNSIDFCLNFRNPYLLENNNNFPSKVLEYFSNNKIVISTIDYPELKDFKYFKCTYNKNDILQTIHNIINMPKNDLQNYKDNRQALINNFSEKKWEENITYIEKF